MFSRALIPTRSRSITMIVISRPHAVLRSSETQYGLIRLHAETRSSCPDAGPDDGLIMSFPVTHSDRGSSPGTRMIPMRACMAVSRERMHAATLLSHKARDARSASRPWVDDCDVRESLVVRNPAAMGTSGDERVSFVRRMRQFRVTASATCRPWQMAAERWHRWARLTAVFETRRGPLPVPWAAMAMAIL